MLAKVCKYVATCRTWSLPITAAPAAIAFASLPFGMEVKRFPVSRQLMIDIQRNNSTPTFWFQIGSDSWNGKAGVIE
jgi:hypothetical protein